MKNIQSITDVPGIRVGHSQDLNALTGCTVILCDRPAIAGVDQRGGAPGTRETDLLRPLHLVQHINAVFLSGGSAFGLDATAGVVRYLEERGIGFDTRDAKVPIVPAAIIYDLGIGRADVRPDADMAYQACINANNKPCEQGNVGAGTGATVGKIFGIDGAMKSGIGTSCIEIAGGIRIGAIVVVNPFGDIIDPNTGAIFAGARTIQKGPVRFGSGVYFANTLSMMNTLLGKAVLNFSAGENTTLGVVATNAKLSKEQVNKVAEMAHDGFSRAIRPAHTMLDGDIIFALSIGTRRGEVNTIGSYAAEAVSQAILNAVRFASPISGLPTALYH